MRYSEGIIVSLKDTHCIEIKTKRAMTAPTAIEFKHVKFAYQPGAPLVIDIPHWQVARGESLFVSGASGSGKSTLLNLICGALTPSAGEITLLDEPFSTLSSAKRDSFRGRHIGVVFQQFNLIPYLTVKQNIQAAAYFGKGIDTDFDGRLKQFLAQLQLPTDVLEQKAAQLSVGQQQRVAIVRALINSPEILVVDEPTSALDADARDAFMQVLLASVSQSNSTLLFVSHDMHLSTHFDHQIDIGKLALISAGAAQDTNHVREGTSL
jgi:putative ABC transport system ATP-binding protein